VEYGFVSRNLLARNRCATILDIGSSGSELSKAIESFGKGKWRVYGIDLSVSGADARMDARKLGLCNDSIDQVICISTIEHVGIAMPDEDRGDIKVMREILRILKKGGSAIISLPYASTAQTKKGFRIYDRPTLVELAGPLLPIKKEFYLFKSGKWVKCSQTTADSIDIRDNIPLTIHSAVCACLLLTKGT
jgi:SAM-dependent methyltransferase